MHLEYLEGPTDGHGPIRETAPDTAEGRRRMRALLGVRALRWHDYCDGARAVARACLPGQADDEDPVRAVYLVDAS